MREFIRDYFGTSSARLLLVAGAGFDPRSTVVGTLLAEARSPIRALLIKENRPAATAGLVQRAEQNVANLTKAIPETQIVPISIFGPDNALVGGRSAVAALARQAFGGITDVIVDLSALSVGISFPLVRYLLELVGTGRGPTNLHIFAVHDPDLDEAIRSTAGDSPGFVHGFRGGWALDRMSAAAKLWLPQLARGRRSTLARLHEFVAPHDTCPILPFPSRNPRLGDELAEHYLVELESAWTVDSRNIVYAAEDDPSDLYRTILRLDDLRRRVFEGCGGSLLVLSPVGSKLLALGALMAALERDLPVAHLEAIGYDLDAPMDRQTQAPHLAHIWLEGDAYPKPRPPLATEKAS